MGAEAVAAPAAFVAAPAAAPEPRTPMRIRPWPRRRGRVGVRCVSTRQREATSGRGLRAQHSRPSLLDKLMVGTLGHAIPRTNKGLELRERCVHLAGHRGLLGLFLDDLS